MKYLLLTISLLLLSGCGQSIKEEPLGAQEFITSKLADPLEVVKIDSLKSEIDDLQKDVKAKEKYNQVLRTTNADGIEYEVHEYKMPNGDTGYQRILYLDNGEIISEGFGPEADARTYHFIPTVPDASPTST